MYKKHLMTRKAASRIQSHACMFDGGVDADSFPSRATSAAYRNFPLKQQEKDDGTSKLTIISVALVAAIGIDFYFFNLKYSSSIVSKFIELARRAGHYVRTDGYNYINSNWPSFFPTLRSTTISLINKAEECLEDAKTYLSKQ